MAGHPTVGTTFILARERMLESSGRENAAGATTIRLEEGVGTIPVRVEWKDGAADFIEMSQPLPTFGARVEDAAAVAGMISLDPSEIDERFPVEIVSCGVPFLFVPLKSLGAARRARPRIEMIERVLGELSHEVFVFTTETEFDGSGVHSRMFAPGLGVTEDPATGGASGPLGCYLLRHGVIRSAGAELDITSEQGVEMGRPSFIRIRIAHEGATITRVRVGGRCRFVGGGHLELDV
jgi:trans-2,3-dihydro-3-hydroxyanthranilate isomerase